MPGIVAISGKSGCGNSTVSALVAGKLGFKLVNYTFKNLAADRGLTFQQVMELSRTDDSFDRAVDSRQVEDALRGERVVGSRLAIWLLKDSADLRVYLWASPETRAIRIRTRESSALYGDPEFTRQRDLADHSRYLRLYGLDTDDYAGADLVFNTERFQPEQISDLIVMACRARGVVSSGNPVEGGKADGK
jgi:cytidylate kinase